MAWVVFIVSILFNASSGVLIKFGVRCDVVTKSYLLIGAGYACGAVSALLYTKALEELNLGVAATISAGLVILFSNLAGVVFFGETVSVGKIFGTLLVCIGIWLLVR